MINPVGEQISCILNTSYPKKVIELEIRDMMGRIQTAFSLNPQQGRTDVSSSSLAPGVYLAVFNNQDGQTIYSQKIIKY